MPSRTLIRGCYIVHSADRNQSQRSDKRRPLALASQMKASTRSVAAKERKILPLIGIRDQFNLNFL